MTVKHLLLYVNNVKYFLYTCAMDIVILVLESQLLLAKQVALLDPLRDLAANESDTTFLSPEYK